MLSSAHPALAYGRSQIHTMPYGFGEGVTHIGALDMLSTESTTSLFDNGESLGATESDRAASRLRCNLDFRLNYQSLAMCLTPKTCLGDRAWPNSIDHHPQTR